MATIDVNQDAENKEIRTLVNNGITCVQSKQYVEAKSHFLAVLQNDSGNYDGLINLGMLCQEMGEGEEAIGYLKRALEVRPKDPSGRNNLGVVLSEQGKFDEAITCYEELLADTPGYALAWNNLGNALRSVRRNEDALEALKKALAIKTDYAEAYNNLGIIYTQLERFAEAIESFNRALLLRADYPEAHANRGLVYLLLGDFQKGWADYEWRWQGKSGLKRRQYSGKPWDGSPLAGKRLLLYFEQGIGDTFQFIRYAKELKARGATVILECQRITREILSRTPGIDEFVIRGDKPPACDFYAPVLSLPGLCQTDLENLPQRVPYIFTDPTLAWDWKQRLGKLSGFKVGIVWQGNPEHKGDRNRSIPLKTFAPLAAVPGVRLVTLQKNFGVEQIESLDGLFSLTDFKGIAENVDGFLRTAAIIANLDLVISADTSVAHLAGAMGVPVWIALPTSPDWRWLLGREDTPWYPTMRLFRQKESGEWPEVFDRIAIALKERVESSKGTGAEPAEVIDQAEAVRLHREAGEFLRADDKNAEAMALLEKAVKHDPRNAGVQQDLGVTYAKAGRLDEAIKCFRQAMKVQPDAPELHSNLGLALLHKDEIDQAIGQLRRAIWLGAGSADVHKNLARALMAAANPAAAEDELWSALRLRPDDAEAHYHLSIAMLTQGKFDQGWLEHEWRLLWRKPNQRQIGSPRWSGQDLAGKRLLVRSESDPRDTVQLARYAELLVRRGGKVILECEDDLVEVMAGCVGVTQVVGLSQPIPAHAFQVNLLSLPALCSTEAGGVPAARPYLGVQTEAIGSWRDKLGIDRGQKIGLALEGDSITVGRSNLPHALIQQIGRWGTDLNFVDLKNSFSQDEASRVRVHQLAGLRENPADKLADLSAVLRNLDVLIASDNRLAHIAAAMGMPVWVILPYVPHHRWGVNQHSSVWYPSVRLFRQRISSDWNELLARVAGAVLERL